jgi:hypothetical protein
MNETLLDVLRNVLVGAGVLVAPVALARGFPTRMAIGAGIELWIAGGLLKLSAAAISWSVIATILVVIAIRKVAVTAFPTAPLLRSRTTSVR